MQKTIVLILALASFVACDLTKLEPAQTNSFMKHFGANGDTESVDLLKVEDGYLILGINTGGDFANVTSVLLKTDLNGNLLWKNQYEDFMGRSMTTDGSSYFLLGDSINGSNPTTMKLIKTDLQGVAGPSTTLAQAGYDVEGYGSLISAAGDLVITGRRSPLSGTTDLTFIYGYDPADLSNAWSELRKDSVPGNTLNPSNRLFEEEPDLFAYNQISTNTNSVNVLQIMHKKKDSGASDPVTDEPLSGYTFSSTIGDLTNDLALVQTVIESGQSRIAFSNGVNETTLNPDDINNDYYAGSLTPITNGYIVLGSTNNVDKSQLPSRADNDFFVQKIGYNGQLESTGFTTIFGGTGSEEGKAVLLADDGGIVILGTITNTNNAKTMVLVKLTSKGELIN